MGDLKARVILWRFSEFLNCKIHVLALFDLKIDFKKMRSVYVCVCACCACVCTRIRSKTEGGVS